MASIGFGGDAENFMEAPRMENKGLAETLAAGSGSFIAGLLDLVGLHRQVAKGPKEPDSPVSEGANPDPSAKATVPSVLNDVSSALALPSSMPTPPLEPMTEWGKKWTASLAPLTTFDPG